jgi:hypothetical protein
MRGDDSAFLVVTAFRYLKVLLMAAKTEFVLITFSHMCFSNDSSESIVTPLSLTHKYINRQNQSTTGKL